MVYLADVLCRMDELEANALAMAACREAPALDDRDLVRHIGVLRIVGDTVDPALRDNLAGVEFLRHCACSKIYCSVMATGRQAAMFRRGSHTLKAFYPPPTFALLPRACRKGPSPGPRLPMVPPS
jgi:hypothetical protein